MSMLHKAAARWRESGPKGLARAAAEEAKRRISDHRTVLVLRVDLTNPDHRLRDRDRRLPAFREFELRPFTRATLPELLAMAERHEPARAASIHQRLIEGARGFTAVYKNETVGYVYWTDGTDHPDRLVHTDLHWLGIHPGRGELYAFDYFLIEPARGLGNLFARTVQEEHHRLGYSAAYGFVFSTNRAALWLYRTTGWTEVRRVEEHRLLSRFARVGQTIYWMSAFSRSPMLALPSRTEDPWKRS